ncbi:unnamed protein product [Paramecium pentaurelia]|uniref:Glutathione S-transferase n=1 Tax=Paramecium pentaurelia TaxID=43138 RepID=A0A8S1TQ72_9CILI|nr:unnamed protein product [Paramecium pentaurelia]
MSIQLYFNPLSQPSRAVHALLVIGKIPHDLHNIDFMKQEQNTPEYKKISPTGNVPSIVDGDVVLFESHTILKYLAKKFKLEKLYPSDIVKQAKLDQYLDWHHTGTRQITLTARDFVFYPKFVGKPAPENKDERFKELEWYLKAFEEIFLGNGKHQYIFGFPEPTIADLSAICELSTLFMLNIDLVPHPHLHQYIKHMLSIPEVNQIHQQTFGFTQKFAENLRQEYIDLMK